MGAYWKIAGFGLALVVGIAPVMAARANPPEAMVVGQRHGSGSAAGRTCPGGQDSECSGLPLPRAQSCPGGAQRTPSACCRMGYCGICWTDCPAH
jgi:hypothetical protein